MALNLRKKVFDYLKGQPNTKLTTRELAEWVFSAYPEECQKKKHNSQYIQTDTDLIRQIAAEIGACFRDTPKQYAEIKMTEGRPRKYYYSDKSDAAEVEEAESPMTKEQTGDGMGQLREHDLYPLLSLYLWKEFGVHSKRIDEKRSSNTKGANGNRWLYPDVVGMEDLGTDWHQEIRSCVKEYSAKRTKLWSFEVKLLLNRSNVRECFFQTVSNSSWANFGYLVAAEIEGQDSLKELRMLFAAHGIGVIKLDPENPSESQVLIPARERDEIDWDMMNRLGTENRDFLKYIKLIKQFYQIGEVRPSDWDQSDTQE